MLYLEKNINFMATMNIQSKMPLLRHTHISHSLILTNRTTSSNICSTFLPIHLSSRDSRYLVWQLRSSQFHRHTWLIPQVVNQGINKLLSRGLRRFTSAEFSLEAGFQQHEANFWLWVR